MDRSRLRELGAEDVEFMTDSELVQTRFYAAVF